MSQPEQSAFSPVVGSRKPRQQAALPTGGFQRNPTPQKSDSPPPPETSPPQISHGGFDLRKSLAALAFNQRGRLKLEGTEEPQAHFGRPAPLTDINSHSANNDSAIVETFSSPLPTCPSGRFLLINCLTTWGDADYIGLTGIELFNELGEAIPLGRQQVMSNSPATEAGECHSAGNLASGINVTTDATQMWLTEYRAGQPHIAIVVLPETVTLSALRIWNYNRSRVHATRGARLVEITFDDVSIFKGEVRKATGEVDESSPQSCAEMILFSDDLGVQARVAETAESLASGQKNFQQTGTNGGSFLVRKSVSNIFGSSTLKSVTSLRQSQQLQRPNPTGSYQSLAVRRLDIEFVSSWGGGDVVGLSGLRFFDGQGEQIDVETLDLELTVRSDAGADAKSMPLDALVDDDPGTAWYARLLDGLTLTITFNAHLIDEDNNNESSQQMLQPPQLISAVGVANAVLFDTMLGARLVRLYADGKRLDDDANAGLVLRKAPPNIDALLFQTISTASLGRQGLLSQSVTAAARVAIKRVVLATAAPEGLWPAWYPNPPLGVPMLPTGYVCSVQIRPLLDLAGTSGSPIMSPDGGALRSDAGHSPLARAEEAQHEEAVARFLSGCATSGDRCHLSLVHNLFLFNEEGADITGEALICTSPPMNTSSTPILIPREENTSLVVGVDASPSHPFGGCVFHFAFETLKCFSAIRVGVQVPSTVEVVLLFDEVVGYQGHWGSQGEVCHKTVPFTNDEAVLQREREFLVSGL